MLRDQEAYRDKQMERGVVILPEFNYDGAVFELPNALRIEPNLLRHYLLYWDKIDYPHNVVDIGEQQEFHRDAMGDDIVYLHEVGIIQRTAIQRPELAVKRSRSPQGFAHDLVACQLLAVDFLERQQPGQWSMAQYFPSFLIPDGWSTPTRSLEIELYDSLPTPGEDISLDDVLEFKQRYSDELLAFRSYMDELYGEIVKSGDIPRAKVVVLARLEKAIADLNKAAEETFVRRVISGMGVHFTLPGAVRDSLAGSAVATIFGLPLELGAAVGAAASTINFNLREKPALANDSNNAAYLCHVKRELAE
jgi:hypothetical protein